MNTVLFLVLRRMRAPLLLISIVYTIATFGLTIIPGVDDQGNPIYENPDHGFRSRIFLNNSDGTFTDVTEQAGMQVRNSATNVPICLADTNRNFVLGTEETKEGSACEGTLTKVTAIPSSK